MKNISLRVLLLLPIYFLLASQSYGDHSAELDRLQTSYKEAVERATDPLTRTYLTELEKLRDSYTRSGNLTGANNVQMEINRMNQAVAFAKAAKKVPTTAAAPIPAAAGASGPAANAVTIPEPRWYVGKTWHTNAQTKWTFAKDGTGDQMRGNTRTAIFTWRLLESGLVEVSQQAAPGKPVSLSFVQFKSKSEAWFGPSPANLTAPLHYD